MKRRIGILTSGGDCPGLNAAIRGVARAAYEMFDAEIVGIHDGYRGLIEGDYQEMKRSDFSGILTLGGTILGTRRTPFSEMRVIGEDQIDKVKKMPAMETFPAMIVALTAGAIDGYISERPGAVSAMASNPSISYVAFEEGKGFEASPEDVAIAVGVVKNSELTEKINAILANISREERSALMDAAVAAQPLSE